MRLAFYTGSLGLLMAAGTASAVVVINETRINEPFDDYNEFFELKGDPGESLADLTYIVIGDSSTAFDGYVECVVSLAGQAVNAAGFFVVAEETFGIPGGIVDLTVPGTNPLNFENGDNVTHMLVAGFTGAVGDDLDIDDDGVLDVTPWTAILDDFALIDPSFPAGDLVYSATLIGPDGSYHPGHVYRCDPDGAWLVGAFDIGVDDTPGATNPICAVDTDGDGVADFEDNCPFNFNPFQEDCDNDGIGDVCAIADGISQDCDGSGVPDECENLPDLNGNNVPDICEITPPTGLVMNELRVSQPGPETDEYFELKGDPETSLHQLRYLVLGDSSLSGDSGVIECIVDLNNLALGADGLFLAAEDTYSLGSIFDVDLLLSSDFNRLNFEEFDNVTHLLVANFHGTINQDLDTDDDGVLDVTPWLAVIDAVGLIQEPLPPVDTEWAYGAHLGFVDVGPDDIYLPSQVYRCVPDTTWTIGVFDPPGETDTPAAENLDCSGGPTCPADLNGDNNVNVLDLLDLLAAWGATSGPADINGDGIVDVLDLLDLLAAWGPCP